MHIFRLKGNTNFALGSGLFVVDHNGPGASFLDLTIYANMAMTALDDLELEFSPTLTYPNVVIRRFMDGEQCTVNGPGILPFVKQVYGPAARADYKAYAALMRQVFKLAIAEFGSCYEEFDSIGGYAADQSALRPKLKKESHGAMVTRQARLRGALDIWVIEALQYAETVCYQQHVKLTGSTKSPIRNKAFRKKVVALTVAESIMDGNMYQGSGFGQRKEAVERLVQRFGHLPNYGSLTDLVYSATNRAETKLT